MCGREGKGREKRTSIGKGRAPTGNGVTAILDSVLGVERVPRSRTGIALSHCIPRSGNASESATGAVGLAQELMQVPSRLVSSEPSSKGVHEIERTTSRPILGPIFGLLGSLLHLSRPGCRKSTTAADCGPKTQRPPNP
jgi:hypothetical protein